MFIWPTPVRNFKVPLVIPGAAAARCWYFDVNYFFIFNNLLNKTIRIVEVQK
jgi:hypothetical protein